MSRPSRAAPVGAPGTSLGRAAADWAGMREVRLAGRPLRYREAGDGPTVVLVHGLGVSSDYWYRNAPALAAAGYRVLGPDLPGFGRSPGPRGGLSAAAQADALAGWSDAIGLSAPGVFIGHSVSCQSVLELAAREPARVAGLVLAAPTNGSTPAARQIAGLALDALREPVRLYPTLLSAYLRAGPIRYWNTWRHSRRHDARPLLPTVACPTLIVVGTRDPVVPRVLVDELANGLPHARVRWLPGAAHAVLFDDAGEFNDAVLGFLGYVLPVTNIAPP